MSAIYVIIRMKRVNEVRLDYDSVYGRGAHASVEDNNRTITVQNSTDNLTLVHPASI